MFLLLFLFEFSVAQNPLYLLLSENQQTGINEYKNALGTTITATANFGLAGYFDNQLSRNKCLLQLSKKFYSNIKSYDNKIPSIEGIPLSTRALPSERGFLWNKALEYSNGDKQLAFMLIGICGHDDKAQNDEKFISCPNNDSKMYRPESLGEGIDISENLKKEIIGTQGDLGSENIHLKAKYYHIIGSAFTSCLLLRRNVPEVMAKTITTTAASGYRSGRLCEAINSGIFNESNRSKLLDCSINGEKSSFWKDMSEKFNFHSGNFKNKIEILVSHIDAYLYLASDKQIREQCLKGKVSGQLNSFLQDQANMKSLKCPQNLTESRCSSLRHRLLTWSIDLKWTTEQHSVGFNFALKNCPRTLNDDSEIESSGLRA